MPSPLERLALVLATAAALWWVGACGQLESVDDASLALQEAEQEMGITRLPSEFTNLEVLPAEITKEELKREMKLMTKSLGIKCDYCHRTDIRDYASDEIREKVVARDMMRLVETLNREHFTWEDAPEATCFMCHHGEQEPQLNPGALVPVDGGDL